MNRPNATALLLLLAACSGQAERENPDQVLCAAEALHQARQPGTTAAESDRLRARASRFREMLPAAGRDEGTTRIEALADGRGRTPLVSPATCDALLGNSPGAM